MGSVPASLPGKTTTDCGRRSRTTKMPVTTSDQSEAKPPSGLGAAGDCRHETLWTVVDEQPTGGVQIRRWRDPVEAQRDADGAKTSGHAAQVVPPIRP